jgi:hypothetical protein
MIVVAVTACFTGLGYVISNGRIIARLTEKDLERSGCCSFKTLSKLLLWLRKKTRKIVKISDIQLQRPSQYVGVPTARP